MKYHSKLFSATTLGSDSVDIQLNRYLENHPEYIVDKLDFQKGQGCSEYLIVVFKEYEKSNNSEADSNTDNLP